MQVCAIDWRECDKKSLNDSGTEVPGLVVEFIPVRRCGWSNLAVRCMRRSLIETERERDMGEGKSGKA